MQFRPALDEALYYKFKELSAMKKLTQVMLATGLISAAFAVSAQESPITANVTLTSDYLYRGISQTSGGPAIQGGFDYVSESGFYVGTWASSITFDDSIEIDYYAGYTGSLTSEIGYDVGLLYYDYPGQSSDDFLEAYAVLTYGALSASVNYSDDFFAGVGKAAYATLDYGFDLGNDIGLNLHYGYQKFEHTVFGNSDDYSEYNVSLSKAFSGVDLTLTYSDTDLSDSDCGGSEDCSSTFVFSIGKSF